MCEVRKNTRPQRSVVHTFYKRLFPHLEFVTSYMTITIPVTPSSPSNVLSGNWKYAPTIMHLPKGITYHSTTILTGTNIEFLNFYFSVDIQFSHWNSTKFKFVLRYPISRINLPIKESITYPRLTPKITDLI